MPITGKQQYSAQGLALLSRNLQHLEDLPFTAEEQRREAAILASKLSIQGIQPKLSAKLNVKKNSFEIVTIDGNYILKPQSDIYLELPENEDLSMRLASMVGIEVPFHGLIYSKDGSLTYFIKRFDRTSKNKIAVEDFAQLANRKRDDKYSFSMERLIPIIEQYCTFPAIEKAKFFKRVLFNYIIGNEDMHLKNFSLIVKEKKVELAPAYDFLNSTIALRGASEEIALALNGKKRNLRQDDFVDYYAYERLGLNQKTVDKIIKQITSQFKNWEKLIEISFLTPAMKEKYLKIINERINVFN
jgi:serine/threonine-protein kinase HipA